MIARGLLSAALLLGLGVVTGRAVAQETRDELLAELREDCGEATRILTEERAPEKRSWALRIISACPQRSDVLVRLWRDPPEGERELSQLYWVSRGVRDGDIFEAAFEVASSPSRPPLPRITALGVLASYVEPDLTLHLDGLEPVEGMGPIEWNNVWGWGADLSLQEVETPLPEDFGVRTLELVRRLKEADDSRVRAAVWWLLTSGGRGFVERAVTNPPPDTVGASWVAPIRREHRLGCLRAHRLLTGGGCPEATDGASAPPR